SKFTTALLACIRVRHEARARIEGETARLCQTRDDQRRQRDELDKEREGLRPLVEAKRQGHWWTKNWWQAPLQGNGASRWDELEARAGQLQESVAALEGRLAALAQEQERSEGTYQAESARLLRAEIKRRQAELDDQEAALRQEQSLLDNKWQALCQAL